MKKIKIINGPNLNLLGRREKEIYGDRNFKDFLAELKRQFPNIKIDYFQSNVEGEIISELQRSDGNYTGVILNAGGYSHTSVAIADTIAAISIPVVEVHISNIAQREEFRKTSLIASKCVGSIMGFGLRSYELAMHYIAL